MILELFWSTTQAYAGVTEEILKGDMSGYPACGSKFEAGSSPIIQQECQSFDSDVQ
jgi:hypothetical protein